MSMRRFAKGFRKNWKRLIGMVVVAAIVGMAAALLSRGVDSAFRNVSTIDKALSKPEQLTEQEKADLKKMYEGLSPAEKESAKQKAVAR
jgi:hypothetical protein